MALVKKLAASHAQRRQVSANIRIVLVESAGEHNAVFHVDEVAIYCKREVLEGFGRKACAHVHRFLFLSAAVYPVCGSPC